METHGKAITSAQASLIVGAVQESDYAAQSILMAVVDDTPLPVTVAASTIVGRTAAGDVAALTATQARAVLNVADGADVTGSNPPQAHAASHVAADAIQSATNAQTGLATAAQITTLEGTDAAGTARPPTGHGSDHTDGTDDAPDLVGDSGAGGTHGLAPAPAAGDTAAGKYLDADGTWTVPPAGETWLDSSFWQHGYVVPLSAGAMSGDGIEATAPVENDATASIGSDHNGLYFQQNTAAAAGSDAETYSGAPQYSSQANPEGMFHFEVNTWADTRWFVCFSSSFQMADSTTPSAHYIGLRYVHGTDTEFKIVSDNGTRTPNVELFDSHPSPGDGTNYFGRIQVTGDGASATVYLYTEAGVLIDSKTVTTKLPTPTTLLRAYSGLEARNTVVRSLKQYGWRTRQKGSVA